MAVVDSLLGLVVSQRAQGLVIHADAAPELILADGQRPLSMPPIPAETVAAFAVEIDGVNGRYETSGGEVFQACIEGQGASLRLTFSPVAEEVATPAPAPAASGQPPPQSAGKERRDVDARLLDLLARMGEAGASDLLLSSGLAPRLRIGGELRTLEGPVVDDEGILALLGPAVAPLVGARLELGGSVDLPLELGGGPDSMRFRANLFRQQRGLAVAVRPIRLQPPTLPRLSLPERLTELVGFANGLVLVVGPSGAGKSTTLVALVEHLNRQASRHIVTLEDPIEYEYTPKQSLIHQRELGRHVESFAAGLRAALRETPDVILVGEMRDRETIAAALTAAETGHLVLSTLHSANPWMAIERVIDAFPGDQQGEVRAQLATVLRAVLAQHLLVSTAPPARVPAYELLVGTPAVANQIRDDKIHQLQSTIQAGRDEGMMPLETSLAALVNAGRLEVARARALVRDPEMFAELLG